MAVRSTMTDLITLVRLKIYDPAGGSQQFSDQQIQDRLDANRDDIRYEQLAIAPSIVNTASTNNQPSTIFADYYSGFTWWESDCVLQGNDTSGNSWKVLTPVSSDYITGHWTFESNVFTTGTVPGQLPPLFITGKVYDVYAAAADLLEFWASALSCAYNISVDGQRLDRSQLMSAKLTMAKYYRSLSKPATAKMTREDVAAPISSRSYRLLDSDDVIKGP